VDSSSVVAVGTINTSLSPPPGRQFFFKGIPNKLPGLKIGTYEAWWRASYFSRRID